MLDHPSFDQHERVGFAHAATGLRAIVAAHSSVRGPVAARCRFWQYESTISVGREYLGGASAESILAEIHRIPVRLTEIFFRSSATDRPTSELADEMARQLLLAEAR